MIIGMCGGEFPHVRDYIGHALPEAEIVVIDHGTMPPRPVDVLVPAGGVVSAELIDAARPRLIQQFGVGLQGVDMKAARERGIPVGNVPSEATGNAGAVAEVVILLLLALLRRFPEAEESVRNRRVGEPIGIALEGKTVTVLGTGAIGGRVIRLLDAFGAMPRGVGRSETSDILPPDRYFTAENMGAALRGAHALVVAVPLTEQTRGIIGADQFAAMPPGGYLVNVGRGSVVDYPALRGALREGHLAGAGLDVTWSEPVDPEDDLLKENVIVTPHIGGVTRESFARMAAVFATNVKEALGREPSERS